MQYARYFARRTKIVCTIGPASNTPVMIERLIKAGMNVARFNLSHGTHAQHASCIETTRKIAERLHVPVAIMVDLPGAKYRTGSLRNGSASAETGCAGSPDHKAGGRQ